MASYDFPNWEELEVETCGIIQNGIVTVTYQREILVNVSYDARDKTEYKNGLIVCNNLLGIGKDS